MKINPLPRDTVPLTSNFPQFTFPRYTFIYQPAWEDEQLGELCADCHRASGFVVRHANHCTTEVHIATCGNLHIPVVMLFRGHGSTLWQVHRSGITTPTRLRIRATGEHCGTVLITKTVLLLLMKENNISWPMWRVNRCCFPCNHCFSFGLADRRWNGYSMSMQVRDQTKRRLLTPFFHIIMSNIHISYYNHGKSDSTSPLLHWDTILFNIWSVKMFLMWITQTFSQGVALPHYKTQNHTPSI